MGPPGGPGLYVENYDALRALDATIWPSGYQAVVGGYNNVGDGGFGVFFYSPAASNDDNDGTILAPTNAIGRWFRIYSGAVDVRWFGAVGDGATNDATAIQNAINYLEGTDNGGALYLPANEYLIETAISIAGTKNLRVFGDGWGPGGTVISVSGAINGLEMGSGSADRTVDLRIEGMHIQGDDTDTPIGIVVNRLHDIVLNDIKLTAFTVAGVDMNMAYNNRLNDLTIDGCDRGIIIDENNEYTRIENCKFLRCPNIGLHFRNGSCSGSKVINCRFEANDIALKLDAGTVENMESFGVIGCYFKDQVSANCRFGTDASAFFIDSLLFQNNEIKAGTVSAATNTVEFDLCRKPTLIGNTFNSANVVTSANVVDLVDLGNTYNSSTPPTELQFGNPDGLFAKLPTSDPAVTDQLWNDGGVVSVSP